MFAEGTEKGSGAQGLLPAGRPVGGWTPGVIPDYAGAAVPREGAQIVWAR